MSADPRGPHRRIIAVDRVKNEAGTAIIETLVTKDCGHTSPMAHHFDYRVGRDIRCFKCGPHGDRKSN